MSEKEENDVNNSYGENISSLSTASEFSIALEKKTVELMNRISTSPAFENLAQITQELAESVYGFSTSPIIENIVNFNQQLAEAIYRTSASPALDNVLKFNQQLADSIVNLSTLPAIENLANLNEQWTESMNKLFNSPAVEASLINVQQVALLLGKLSINISVTDTINGNENISEFANILYKSSLLPDILEIPNEEISRQEIHDVLQEENLLSQYKSLERKIDNLSEKIDKNETLQDKITKKDVILMLIQILLLPFFHPFLGIYSNWAQQPATQIIKTIKNEIKSTNEKEIYREIRIVKENGLQVKRSNRRDSQTIGDLNIGEIVEITTKKKNWSRIKIIKGNEIIEGWVYTRYLQKIN